MRRFNRLGFDLSGFNQPSGRCDTAMRRTRVRVLLLGTLFVVMTPVTLAHHHEHAPAKSPQAGAQQTQTQHRNSSQTNPAIDAVMHAMWPGALTLAAISEQGDVALVSWHYTETSAQQDVAPSSTTEQHKSSHHAANSHTGNHAATGDTKHGRALWRKVQGRWQLISCAGKALMTEAYLQTSGLSSAQATQLLAQHRQAEAQLDPADVLLFDQFMQPQSH